VASVTVHYRDLSDAEIEHYLRAEQPTTAPAAPPRRSASPCSAIESDDPTASSACRDPHLRAAAPGGINPLTPVACPRRCRR
jgi:septum formation protein